MVKMEVDIDMSKIVTKVLVEELSKIEGVCEHVFGPEDSSDKFIVEGPCRVFVVTD